MRRRRGLLTSFNDSLTREKGRESLLTKISPDIDPFSSLSKTQSPYQIIFLFFVSVSVFFGPVFLSRPLSLGPVSVSQSQLLSFVSFFLFLSVK